MGTSAKLAKSNYYVYLMKDKIGEIAFNEGFHDFTTKQTDHIAQQMINELGSDNPNWKKRRK